MAEKYIDVPGVGTVLLVKTARNRSIKLSLTSHGGVRVSLPRWTPYAVALAFVSQHSDWILTEQAKRSSSLLHDADKIGKLHTLHFELTHDAGLVRTRVTPTKLIVYHRPSEPIDSLVVQQRAEAAAIKALRKEAQVVLPPRVDALASRFGMKYESVSVKKLVRRWGSCDSHGAITLNLFLMQLSWQQIDYVIAHELSHTKYMDHGSDFWREVERMVPDARMIAKKVRYIQPALLPRPTAISTEE